MSAIAGLWSGRDAPDLERSCRDMLAAQSDLFDGRPRTLQLDGVVLGGGSGSRHRSGAPALARAPEAARVALVADLRLDNREELSDSLGVRGGALRSASDADLLLAALLRWQHDAVDRLVGDFAFAFFDGARQRLVLARDPLGQRPLFWRRDASGFAFSSMPRGLHAAGAARNPDLATLARYMAALPQDSEASFYSGIQRVRPGHLLIVTPGGQSSVRYWQPSRERLRFTGFGDAVAAFRFELDRAVRSRLDDAGATVATHLSGGWDSSAVTATAARLLGGSGRVAAFTAVPNGGVGPVPASRLADEGRLAAATASLYGNIDHRLVPSDRASIVDTLDRSAALFERPPFNPCNHGWLARIRAAAREAGAHVLLTGEIGNWTLSAAPTSLLADYVRQGRLREWWRETRAMTDQGRARWRGVGAASFGPWLPTPLWRRIQGLSSSAASETALRPAFADLLAEEMDEQLFGQPARPKDNMERTRAAFHQMDFGEYRSGILAGWGIDKRDATADRRLLEFCLRLPIEMLLSGGTRRPLARAALADRLPAAVLDERRKGLQAANWHTDLTAELPRLRELVDRIEHHPSASLMIDTGLLRRWLREWPSGGWHRPEIVARYRIALLVALAAGHFAIHASGRNGFVERP